MAIEIVSFPMKNGGSFHNYVKLPEGKTTNQNLLEIPSRKAQESLEQADHAGWWDQVMAGLRMQHPGLRKEERCLKHIHPSMLDTQQQAILWIFMIFIDIYSLFLISHKKIWRSHW